MKPLNRRRLLGSPESSLCLNLSLTPGRYNEYDIARALKSQVYTAVVQQYQYRYSSTRYSITHIIYHSRVHAATTAIGTATLDVLLYVV